MLRQRPADVAAVSSATMHLRPSLSLPRLMSLERLAWSAVIAVFLIAAAVFVHNGFNGYGLLSALLALAASVNLWTGPADE